MEGKLKCPQVNEKKHLEITYNKQGFPITREVTPFLADIDDATYCESFLSAVEKDSSKSGCMYKKDCPVYKQLKEKKQN